MPGALPGGPKVAHLMAHSADPRARQSRCGEQRSRTWKPVDLRTSPAGMSACARCAAMLAPAAPVKRRRPVAAVVPEQYTDLEVAYRETLAAADLSDGSRRIYASRLRGYFAYLGDTDPAVFENRDPFTDPHGRNYAVREFLGHLKTVQHAKPTTIKSYHAALDHYYGYHLDLGRAVADRERLPRWAPRALEPPERKKFLRAADRCESTRDTAIALLLYFSGLRISELAALDVDDIIRSARRCKIIVRDGKGGVYRVIPGLHLLARTAIDAWLTDRAAWLPPRSTERAVFLGRRGDRLGDRRLRDIVGAIATDAGIEAAPHDLRHTLATMLREQGYDLSTIAEVLGHASVDVTARYTLASEAETAAALENLTIDI